MGTLFTLQRAALDRPRRSEGNATLRLEQRALREKLNARVDGTSLQPPAAAQNVPQAILLPYLAARLM
jgi:hypothetical protein